MTRITATTPARAALSRNQRAEMNTASSAAAVSARVRNKRSGVGCGWQRFATGLAVLRRFELFADAPEAPLARTVGSERGFERGGVEIRPQRIGEMQLGIGKLPEQKIAHAPLAAGADEQVRLRCVIHREPRRQVLLGEAPRRPPPGGPRRARRA